MKERGILQRRGWGCGLVGILMLLGGCEAKLRLEAVDAAREQAIRRTDHFQSAVANAERMVVVGTHGLIVTSADQGKSWQRFELAGWPSLIDITACPDGELVALAYEGQIWTAPATADAWTMHRIESAETPQALTCDPAGRIWVVGGFSSFTMSADHGKTWSAQSLDEDLFLTTIQFFDGDTAIATGEFGTVVKTIDAGATWQVQAPMPDEFYPEDTWFQDSQTGWAVSLRGRVLATTDGGMTWALQSTPTLAPLFSLSMSGGVPYAVGGDGVIVRRVDEAWQAVEYAEPFHLYLRAVAPVGDRLLVAGGSGALRLLSLEPASAVRAGLSAVVQHD